ncbi:MAG: hypothetical protein IJ867_03665 [Clostridia bacterium]|nr:hypothetical protein [Clostridia bacterium]
MVNDESNKTPQTIEELKQWYKDRNLPDENITRFFIGKNYTKAKAFGIYQDEKTGNFVVYKNKANSIRVIRYEGPDEAKAVTELYLKLKEEIANQKNRIAAEKKYNSPEAKKRRKKEKWRNFRFVALIYGVFIGIPLLIGILTPSRGYYYYNDSYYYYQNSSWYLYNDYYGWERTSAPAGLKKHYRDYYDNDYYDYDYGISRFEDSSYYVEPSSSSSSDSSSDWSSSDSWDSGSTDWDSDW